MAEDREEIARIIEPHAWEVLDECGGDMAHPYLAQKVVVRGLIESSLTRADAILARAQGPGPGEAVAREDIERIIADADRRLAYSMSLVRLVDGDHTYRLSIDGETLLFTDSETPDWNAHDRLLAHIAECKGRVRADAILELFSKPLAATPTREA